MVEEWTTCMRLLSWRRHQGTMLKKCVLILPVSDPAKQAVQVVKHHVFDERTVNILLFVCTRHEEECSLLILVDAIHFLKHCPLVSVADKRYIYLFPF
jgi:hypothetical protein